MARVLLDESVPRQLGQHLPGHHVETVPARGWAGARSGELLQRASSEFDVFITGDQNLQHQQNPSRFQLAIIVLVAINNRVETIVAMAPKVLEAIEQSRPGEIARVAG